MLSSRNFKHGKAALGACAAGALACFLLFARPVWRGPVWQGPGWAGSYLHSQADASLNKLLNEASWVSPYRLCTADVLKLEATDVEQVLTGQQGQQDSPHQEAGIMTGVAYRLPCRKGAGGRSGNSGGNQCCSAKLNFRKNTTDYDVYKQVFRCHYMRYFYSLFEQQPPKYILDAGANVGFATVLFKLLWPDATVVSLEPDPDNFAMLQRNTQGFKNVHAVNAGLWGRSADIVLAGSHGYWGRVFREAKGGEKGMPAHSVQDIAKKLGIPAFDFVKIDIEGAEGMVFAPGGDFDWIKQARAVTLEVHDFFAGYFGLTEVTSRVDAAFNTTGYSLASDNEHVTYIAPSLHKQLAAMAPPTSKQLKEARSRNSGAC